MAGRPVPFGADTIQPNTKSHSLLDVDTHLCCTGLKELLVLAIKASLVKESCAPLALYLRKVATISWGSSTGTTACLTVFVLLHQTRISAM